MGQRFVENGDMAWPYFALYTRQFLDPTRGPFTVASHVLSPQYWWFQGRSGEKTTPSNGLPLEGRRLGLPTRGIHGNHPTLLDFPWRLA